MTRYNKGQKTYLVIDIETVQLPISDRILAQFERDYSPPRNRKKEELLAEHKVESLAGLKEKMAFRIGGFRPISVGLAVVQDNRITTSTVIADDNAVQLGGRVADAIDKVGDFVFAGYNIDKFDIPGLLWLFSQSNRILKNRIKKWDNVDLCYKPFFGHGGAKDVAEALGIETPLINGEQVDGSFVAKWYDLGDWESIKSYNLQDVEMEARILIETCRVWDL
jgi:hypothetical protein